MRATPILALGSGLALGSFLLPLLTFKANRLLAGDPISFWQAHNPYGWVAVALWGWLLLLSLLDFKGKNGVYSGLAAAGLLATGLCLGPEATALMEQGTPYSRVSVGSGTWLMVFALYVLTFGLEQQRRFFSVPLIGVLLMLLFSGLFHSLGMVLEYGVLGSAFWQQFQVHVALSVTSVVLAALIGIPLGIYAYRTPALQGPILTGVNLLQTIPSVALFGFLLPVFARLGREASTLSLLWVLIGATVLSLLLRKIRILGGLFLVVWVFPAALLGGMVLYHLLTGNLEIFSSLKLQNPLSDFGIRGIGTTPALMALTLHALLPIVANTVLGLKGIAPEVLDAATGMGMNKKQLFRKIEFPLALPFMAEGLRSSLVLTFGLATIAALISAGGLGFFVLRGVEGAIPDLILLGALPVIVMALLLDLLMRGVTWILTPRGLKA